MAAPAFQIVVIRPAGFIYAESWREALDAMYFGFKELGIEVPLFDNSIEPGATPIIFGAHHLAPGMEERLPPDSVIYNLEQLLPGYFWYSDHYLKMLRRFTVWDFHERNVTHLKGEGINARHVPIGYVPQMSTIRPGKENIDVLFYGVFTERREALIRALIQRGLKAEAFRGVFGAERDALIARSKVVLNLHQEAGGYFEALRVMHLMANRKAVVTECDSTDEIDSRLLPGLRAVPYGELVKECELLVSRDAERDTLAAAAHVAVQHPDLRMSRILERLLAS